MSGLVYKPIKMHQEMVDFIDQYHKGNNNFAARWRSLMDDYFNQINMARWELIEILKENEVEYIINVITKEGFEADNLKDQLLILVHEENLKNNIDIEYNIDITELLQKLKELAHFQVYALYYFCLEYKLKFIDNDKNKIYFYKLFPFESKR